MSYKDNSIKKERSLGGLDTLGKGQRRGGGGGGQVQVIELNRNLCKLCSRSIEKSRGSRYSRERTERGWRGGEGGGCWSSTCDRIKSKPL